MPGLANIFAQGFPAHRQTAAAAALSAAQVKLEKAKRDEAETQLKLAALTLAESERQAAEKWRRKERCY